MNGLMGRCAIAGLVLLLSTLLPRSSAQAREMLRERFERVGSAVFADNTITGRDNTARRGYSRTEKKFWLEKDGYKGVFLDLPVSFDNNSKGAISFDIQRKAGDVPGDQRTVFELLDAQGDQILFAQIRWSSEIDPRFPLFSLKGRDYYRNSLGLWPLQILLNREVRPAQWIHVDLVWDDTAKKYQLFIDGISQDMTPRSYDLKRKAILPDPRYGSAKDAGKGMTRQVFSAQPFAYFISRAKTLRIGVNSHPRKPYVTSSPLSQSVLDNFVVLVNEWPKGLAGYANIASVSDDAFRIPGISGKLVAGDKITVTLVADPGGKASFDMGKVLGIPMAEVPASPGGPGVPAVDNGTYRGTYTIRPGEDYVDGRVVGQFVSSDNVAAEPFPSASRWTIDTQPRVAFSIDRTDLPADSTSRTRVSLTVKDANGNVLKGRRFKLTLATTDEYTGLVGAGNFNKDVGAAVETRWQGQTDPWGTVEFDYRAGFAAKTVILTAKDLESGGVAVDYITSYKEASIDILLTPPKSQAAARRGLQYVMKIEATRTVLTADGQSRSVIRATVTDPTGKPVAGDNVVFSLSSPNGSIRTIEGVTNASGTATAEYIAGKKIGIVVVTATDILRNVSASISLVLLADAPAKIILKVRPDSLPADGFSRADIGIKVTDINDNPNDNTKVEFRIAKGTGRLDAPERVTDRAGDAANRFTAGTTPGTVTIAATVRSKVPATAELARAQNVLFVPYSDKGEEIRVARWLKRKGETALKGEPIVEYTIGRGDAIYALKAPYDCRIEFQHVEYWDYAQTGDTLAQIIPVVIPGSPNTPPAAVAPSLSPRRK